MTSPHHPSNPANLHVVFGSGPLGLATASALLAMGKRVRIVNRSGNIRHLPFGAEPFAADLLDREAASAASAGAQSIYFCAQPAYHRWQQEFPALQSAIIAVACQTGARLIVGENMYAYGPVTGPMTEDMPLRPNTRKGTVRAAMHERLMDAHLHGMIDVAVARASDFFGPLVEASAVGSRLFDAIAEGKPADVFGNPDTLHSYTYIEDFGRAMAILGTDARSSGQVWHVPNAPAVSTTEFVRLAAHLAGMPAKIRRISTLSLRVIGMFVTPIREMIEMRYEFEEPFVVDHSKFAAVFGDIATPLEVSLAQTLGLDFRLAA